MTLNAWDVNACVTSTKMMMCRTYNGIVRPSKK